MFGLGHSHILIVDLAQASTRKAVTKSASKASLSKKSDDKSFASTATVVTTATTGSRKRKQGPTASTTRTSSLKRSRTLPEPVNALPLPVPQDESEKPRSLLVVGTGDTGQFGLGMDTLGTISRPRLHATIHNLVENGSMGPNGIEKVAAGGMHSLVLDSNGKVRSISSAHCSRLDHIAPHRPCSRLSGVTPLLSLMSHHSCFAIVVDHYVACERLANIHVGVSRPRLAGSSYPFGASPPDQHFHCDKVMFSQGQTLYRCYSTCCQRCHITLMLLSEL